jgi:tetraacyldisaccharide 4'-kinase
VGASANRAGAHGSRRWPRWEDRLARRGGALELLRLPASLFGLAVRARRTAYDRGFLEARRLAVPVVSAGNLTTGGTGKTPLVAWLARELAQRGFRPGLLSRGYGAAAGTASDEVRLLARLCPGVPHAQDPDRVRGGTRLVAEGCDALVLDDGFQHRRLARDLDLVLVDATRPWGLPADGGPAVRALLPRGLLREPPSSLARADALVITRTDAVTPDALAALEEELADCAPGRPIVLARHAPRAWVDERGARAPLAALAGREVELVSGVGNPTAFERSVAAAGAVVRGHRRFPDHHAYARGDLDGLATDGRLLVTTEKDAVKLAELGARFQALAIELELVRDEAVLHALLDALPRRGEVVGRLDARRKLRD